MPDNSRFDPQTLPQLWSQTCRACGVSEDTRVGSYHASAAELIVRELQPAAVTAPGGPGGWMDPRSRARSEKIELKRIQKVVAARLRSELVVGFDPLTWFTIGSIVWKVLKLIWNWWHTEPAALFAVQSIQRALTAPNDGE
jgi:hypothetical protein